MSNKSIWLMAGSAMALGLASHASVAADAPAAPSGAQLQEVVVTAQKRAENIETVPLSIVAKSGAQLAQAGVNNIVQLQQLVPNLTFTQNAQTAGVAIRVRGFGTPANTSVDSDVAAYVDGVFIPRPGALLGSFLDISSAEVLRGPQGTLFGRNSTMGALSLNTTAPSNAYSGQVAISGASYGESKLEAIGNLPLSDTFAVRAAAYAETFGGYFKDSLNGRKVDQRDTDAARLSAKWDITPALTWLVRGDYAKTTGSGFNPGQVVVSVASPGQLAAFTADLGGPGNTPTLSSSPSLTTHQLLDSPSVHDDQKGVSSDLTWKAPDGFSLRLIDSYRRWNNAQTDGDAVMTALNLVNRHATYKSDSQSHELQLISPKDALLGGRLDYVAGLYYFQETYDAGQVFDFGALFCSNILPLVGKGAAIPICQSQPQQGVGTIQFAQHETSAAAYAQLNFKLTDVVSLTLGARDTSDRKTASFSNVNANPLAAILGLAEVDPSLSARSSKPTWRANLSWQVTPDVMTFGSVSTGFKSGAISNVSFTGAALPANYLTARIVAPETSTDYELGVKSVLMERHLILNADIFQTELSNFQDRSFNGIGFVIRNAGDVRSRGLEFDAQLLPVDHIKVDLSGAYSNSIYINNSAAPGLPGCTAATCGLTQNLSGQTVDFAPKVQGNFAIEYDTSPFAGGMTAQLRADVNYVDSMFTTNDNNPQSVVPAHTLLGVRLNLVSADKSWTLSAYGANLTNDRYYTLMFEQPLAAALPGVRVASTGATLLRGYQGAPLTAGVSLKKSF